MKEPITMTRDELYELVWSEPVSKIAGRYDLSDKGLAKKCARHNIPCPPTGYWAKVQNGHTPAKTPLPTNNDTSLDAIDFWPKPTPVIEEPTVQKSYLTDDQLVLVMDVKFPEDVKKFHKAIAQCRKEVEISKKSEWPGYGIDKYGRITVTNNICFKVTPKTFDRACRLLNTIIDLFKGLGWNFVRKQYRNGNKGNYAFKYKGQELVIEIKEPVKQVKNDTHSSSRNPLLLDRSSLSTAYDYKPTGTLELAIDTYGMGFKTRWKDIPEVPVENHLVEIAQTFSRAFEYSRLMEVKIEEDKRQRELDDQRQREIQRLEKIEKSCQQQLITLAENHQTACKLKALIASLSENSSEDPRLESWLAWANQVVNHYDPLQQQEEFLNEYEATRNRSY